MDGAAADDRRWKKRRRGEIESFCLLSVRSVHVAASHANASAAKTRPNVLHLLF